MPVSSLVCSGVANDKRFTPIRRRTAWLTLSRVVASTRQAEYRRGSFLEATMIRVRGVLERYPVVGTKSLRVRELGVAGQKLIRCVERIKSGAHVCFNRPTHLITFAIPASLARKGVKGPSEPASTQHDICCCSSRRAS